MARNATVVGGVAVGSRPTIDGSRLLGRIEALARVGADPRGGITRPAFSDADRAAVRLVSEWAREGGLTASVDAAGNLLLRGPVRGGKPVLMIGSHLDTVVNGGRLDGAYGVLAALEALQSVVDQGLDCRHELVVAGFANEEGSSFPQPFWGSMAIAGRAGQFGPEPVDYLGNPLRAALARSGGDLDGVARAAWPLGSIAAYLELHVEQGPVLEQAGLPIGIVDGIVGRTVLSVDLIGRAGHAGTTPMAGRHDALVAAAAVVLGVRELAATRDLCQVSTTGRIEVEPNSTNVVPGVARLTAEVRDLDRTRLAVVERELRSAIHASAAAAGVRAEIRVAMRQDPVITDDRLRAACVAAAESLGHDHAVVSSGAGHDAQVIAGIAPIGMIFVPSRGGVSHVPEEDTAPADLVAGAEVLFRAAVSL
ncbi:N-carbamoyl-L-amino-acid hydrolase [Lentzea xinjiangensis]|uniref:N-carbamoyl-L-amino-acid hydrolase n=1 Tax=Lentzea xinjiangensis TaxID=402600 RepID=A0A1H9WMJ4_9PSEU|nr:Zn-dependent hydrolase [Lentzea xinjiangensis]SES35118.1 N-carbamoyl-L-amino-acid hydrolase [Lentzea xinjiangensis]